MDRRQAARARLSVPFWVNKYIDGYPHLAELEDVSEDGILLRTTCEPSRQEDFCSLEVGVAGSPRRMWLWARNVRRVGNRQALRLVGTELFDRAYLKQLVRWHHTTV